MIARRLLMTGGGGSFASPGGYTTVAPSGGRADVMTGTGYKAFPGMTLLGDRLHLVYRYGSAHNSGSGSEVDYKYTDDDGATWSTPDSARTLVGPTTGTDDLRDPNILALASGRLLLGYNTRNPYTGSDIHAFTIYSDDDAATWSSAYEIPDSFTTDVVSSQPIELPGGDILMPGFGESGGDYSSVLWRSSDDGATWGTQTTIASGGRDYQEPQIRLLASGRIIALHRSESNHHTWRNYSDNDGASWSTPTDVLNFTGRPDFVEIAPGVLFLMGRFDTTADSPLYWTFSLDDGLTWDPETEVDSGETALGMYSAPVVTSEAHVTVVYSIEESGSDADLYLRHYVAS